jgi:hypothetical protein
MNCLVDPIPYPVVNPLLSLFFYLSLLAIKREKEGLRCSRVVGRTHTFLNTLHLANLDFGNTKVKDRHSQQALVDENIRNKLPHISPY